MNAGDTGFMLICTALVFFMTPGLAFFYGGLVRRKNVVNTMMACTFIMGLSVVMWILFGYSLSFGGNHGGIIGDFRWFCLNGIGMDDAGPYAATIPHFIYIAFQMMFAMITPALITGSLVGRVKFKALFFFVLFWSILVYYPMAHMVWGEGGFLAEIGSVDFAGGNVVHISSGVSALVFAIVLGRRKGYENTAYRVHNIPFVALGAFLLWFGWFGFNPGSQLAAATTDDARAISHVFLTTNLAACAGGFFALAVSWMKYGKPSLSLTLNGILAGLVGITAGCDMVSSFGAVIIGTICGILMIYSVEFIDRTLKIDDPVGASSVHGVCGFTGTILTGLFSTSEGLFYGAGWSFLGAQVFGALVVGAWAAGMGFIIFKGLDKIHGLRVSKRVEEEGLDIYEHGESAYGA